ncbi:hypothetical protein D5Q94_04570 [Salmonella enterica subsp. diarizonae serovar 61:k:1,5,(7)]|nr:hypothetical protein [Salmonella enterica]EAW1956399.1 hypothetical protein [Salmonella enterica subsp. enterica]EBH3850450.1 hypothetical protein [Salmonella enterica subsp. diarizonae]EBH9876798.1 hypothetical protein [Salmonella enterica subsp. enterica serovar 6,7:-1,5]ECT4108740.1 hypothetical protein [Salmonella enterica subsp. diarizonae serovar 61:k:1,5,(7)]ECU0280092.1 hypothetical protein [Salmonella enterica subsp. diarizonae serovar 61:k:1,5,7]
MRLAGHPHQHHYPHNSLILHPLFCSCQARCTPNLTPHIVKYLLLSITIIKQKRLFHTRSWKMSIFLIYGYEMSIAMSP